MKIVVLDAATLGEDIDLSPLAACGELTVRSATAMEDVSGVLADADAVIVNKIKLGEHNLSAAVKLKLICVTATGYDNIDTAFCAKKGIAVCNVAGYSTESVVQVTLATVLELATYLRQYSAITADGRYTQSGVANCLQPVFHEISGKTWGVIGAGNIGGKVAQVASAMGCRVLIHRKRADGDPACVSLSEICREADILTLHCPLTPATRGLIGEEQLRLMKDGVILVNEARGAVLDEAAVANAVLAGKIGGFGCDVYSIEPFPADHPYNALLGLPNVCLTPHMAWGSYESRARCIREIALNINAFIRGERRNRVEA